MTAYSSAAVYGVLYREIPPDLSQVLRLGAVSGHRRWGLGENDSAGARSYINIIPHLTLHSNLL